MKEGLQEECLNELWDLKDLLGDSMIYFFFLPFCLCLAMECEGDDDDDDGSGGGDFY